MVQAQENRFEEAKESPTEVHTPGEPPELGARGIGKELPMMTAPDREWVLEATRGILECFYTIHLQTMREMGGVREVDRALTWTLLAEFVRLQLVVDEDFAKSLMALCADMEASSVMLMSDIVRTMDLHPDDPVSHQLRATLRKFQQTTLLKLTLPLTELEAAHEGLEAFMQSHLQELSSQTECRELIGELSQKLTNKVCQVRELVQALELTEGEVSLWVLIGLVAHQPLEANFFPGILEGLAGRLSLAPPGVADPPTSVTEGVSHQWVATLKEAIRRTEGQNVDLRQATHATVPHGFHRDYDLDF